MTALNDIPAIAARCIRTGVNLQITGEPGIGKTSIIEQLVAKIKEADPDFWYDCVYTPSLTPTDFAMMMPNTKSKTLESYRNARLPNSFDTPDLRGILFLGERDNADPATNKALQKYINNEDMGGLKKPLGVIVISDSNHVNHRSGTVQQSLALLSRSRVVNVDVDAECTLKYFGEIGLNAFVQAYLSIRREHVSTFDALLKSKGYGVWANPRSWERLGRAMDDADAHGERLTHEEIIGDVGEAVGREFIAFLKAAKDLVSYAEVVTSPMATTMPDKLSDVYAVIAMLATCTTAQDFPAVRKYVCRFSSEVQVLFLRLLVSGKGNNKSACVKHREYGEWFAQPEIMAAVL